MGFRKNINQMNIFNYNLIVEYLSKINYLKEQITKICLLFKEFYF